MEDFRFKVNLGGMIEILSDHLYSSPDVYIRELLQTGRTPLLEGGSCRGRQWKGRSPWR